MKKKAAQQAVTANRLGDGIVVFLDRNGDWVECVETARVAADKAAADALLAEAEAAADRCEVVGPYLFEVAVDGDSVRPLRYREILRAEGPSVRTDLGKQAPQT